MTTAAAILETEPKTESLVTQSAREAFEQGGDYFAAAELMEGWARKDPALYAAITNDALYQLCYEAVSKAGRLERAAIWSGPRTPVTESCTAKAASASGDAHGRRIVNLSRALLNFPLFGSKKLLRHATKADCIESAQKYDRLSKDTGGKARWLFAIAERLGDKTVEQVFDDAALDALDREHVNG